MFINWTSPIYFILLFRLDFLPEALFKLPSLTTLDVSNNKLQTVPRDIWTSPKLKELNASFNLLTDLPNFLTETFLELSGSGDHGRRSTDLFASPILPERSNSSLSDDDSLDDARMMRSIQLATINLTPQELMHHR